MIDEPNAPLPVVFSFEERAVRTVEIEGAVWFLGRDVCDCLGHKNHNQTLSRLSEDERQGVPIVDPLGGRQINTVISEAGVYQIIFTSRVEAAQRFKRWLAHEVLPAIRRKGEFPRPSVGVLPGTREFADAIQAVRELRLLAGKRPAMELWRRLGLPAVAVAASRPPTSAAVLVRAFLSARTMARGGHAVAESKLWLSFERWRRHEGERRLERADFGSALRAAMPQHREVEGDLLYEGLDLWCGH